MTAGVLILAGNGIAKSLLGSELGIICRNQLVLPQGAHLRGRRYQSAHFAQSEGHQGQGVYHRLQLNKEYPIHHCP